MYTSDQLRRWARPEDILQPDESKRVDEFLSLFESQLRILDAGPEPTIVQLYAARRCAEVVWEFDRTTSSRRVVAGRRKKPSRMLERQDQFEENEVRHRLNNLALEDLDSARTFARVAAGAVETNVIPFNQRKTG